jgi:hypothetical protein
MYTEDERQRLDRARDHVWMWGTLEIRIVENTLDLGDLQPLVETIQPEFPFVEIHRRSAGPMATPLFGDIALSIAIATHGFLGELGKDAYKAFRTALYGLYRKAKTWANGRGYRPLTISIKPDASPTVLFQFEPGMDPETFEKALAEMIASYSTLSNGTAQQGILLRYDYESGRWVEVERC